MRAQVLSIGSVARDAHREWSAELIQQGFDMALAALDSLKCSSLEESKVAIENWMAAEKLTPAMRDALFLFHGWQK